MTSSTRQLEWFQAQDLQRRASPTSLLDLPFELRQQIFRHYIPRGYCIYNNFSAHYSGDGDFVFYEDRIKRLFRVARRGKKFTIDIMCVCRQISEECLDILYGENLFELDMFRAPELRVRELLTVRNIRRIRNVHFVACLPAPRAPAHSPYLPYIRGPDPRFWSMLIPQLRSFILEASEHCEWNESSGYAQMERCIHDPIKGWWANHVEPYLELFGRLLVSNTRNIRVDISVAPEILSLAQRHIPEKYPVRVVESFQCICGKSWRGVRVVRDA